jgi:hypothetical protein
MSNSYTGGCACSAIRYEIGAEPLAAARGFCDRCGSQVFTQPRRFPDRMGVTAGSLDDPGRFRPTVVVWQSRAPNWDRIDPALPSFPENPQRR